MLKGRLATYPGAVRLVVHDPIDTASCPGSTRRSSANACGESSRPMRSPTLDAAPPDVNARSRSRLISRASLPRCALARRGHCRRSRASSQRTARRRRSGRADAPARGDRCRSHDVQARGAGSRPRRAHRLRHCCAACAAATRCRASTRWSTSATGARSSSSCRTGSTMRRGSTATWNCGLVAMASLTRGFEKTMCMWRTDHARRHAGAVRQPDIRFRADDGDDANNSSVAGRVRSARSRCAAADHRSRQHFEPDDRIHRVPGKRPPESKRRTG